jgi:hypothetical protein
MPTSVEDSEAVGIHPYSMIMPTWTRSESIPQNATCRPNRVV